MFEKFALVPGNKNREPLEEDESAAAFFFFGAFGGGSASQPLHVAHGGALQQCSADDGTVARFAAHLACDKLLEKLTGETFDRRKDVWALAACVCEFVAKDTTSFRRELFQAKLRGASPSSLSKPCEGPDAAKTAALCAHRPPAKVKSRGPKAVRTESPRARSFIKPTCRITWGPMVRKFWRR